MWGLGEALWDLIELSAANQVLTVTGRKTFVYVECGEEDCFEHDGCLLFSHAMKAVMELFALHTYDAGMLKSTPHRD